MEIQLSVAIQTARLAHNLLAVAMRLSERLQILVRVAGHTS